LTHEPGLPPDITELEGLSCLAWRVIKFSEDGGQSWRFALMDEREVHVVPTDDGPEFGFTAYLEVLPAAPAHETALLSAEGFVRGLIVRIATVDEYEGMAFAYHRQPPSFA